MAPLATPLRVCACARALADAGARTRVRTCEGAHISVCLGQRVSRPMAMWGTCVCAWGTPTGSRTCGCVWGVRAFARAHYHECMIYHILPSHMIEPT